jgi:group II intron reverse transcriptase/maturase
MRDTSRSQIVATKLQQIAEQAVEYPEMVFTTLMHLVDVDFLMEAYRRVNKQAAPGLDGITAKEYAANLAENLQSLYKRMRSGRYKAPPVKRIWLAEGKKKRPIGISEFEDKIVQRAVAMLLEAVYEQDFYDFSYGFRAGRSPHQALHELREQCLNPNINWIIDADISGFFDHLGHSEMRKIIKLRVNDGSIIRSIGKWLNAGVVEGETLNYPKQGAPQGGVISPILSNIFLHHVLDEWYVKEVQPRLKGNSFLIRFADDFVIGCELEADARRVMAVLPKRFGRFGLAIHPAKTRLVAFRKPPRDQKKGKGKGTFDFLGFTHYWAKSRRGNWVVKRKTARRRLHRAMQKMWCWSRQHRHKPLKEQHRTLRLKLQGYYQYYGIRGNYRMLEKYYWFVVMAWWYWLRRRSHKGKITWENHKLLRLVYPLPLPKITHAI